MDTARLNEIIKYRIDLFTIDKLIEFAEVLDPDLKVEVAWANFFTKSNTTFNRHQMAHRFIKNEHIYFNSLN